MLSDLLMIVSIYHTIKKCMYVSFLVYCQSISVKNVDIWVWDFFSVFKIGSMTLRFFM